MKNRITLCYTIALVAILASSGCYKFGKGNGGTVFYACNDCVQTQTLYVYVDGNKITGKLEKGYYNIVCGPPCESKEDLSVGGDPKYPSYIGPDGDHTFELRDLSGKVYQQGAFTAKKNECTRIQVFPSGCSTSGGGGGGGGGNCVNYTFTGTGSCNNGVIVQPGVCCPTASPYYCASSNKCYSSCSAASSCSGIVYYGTSSTGTGGGGSGGAGYNCVSGSCTYVSSGAQYSTQSACQSSCSGGGGGGCTNMASYLSVTNTVKGNRCNDPNSLEVTVKNNASVSLDVQICIKNASGTMVKATLGTKLGLSPGATHTAYLCTSTGSYSIKAKKESEYASNCPTWSNCP